MAKKLQRQRSTTVKKLPTHQLSKELKLSMSVQDLNRILRYVSYDCISDVDAAEDIIVESSDIMAAVMIERLARIILKLNFKSSHDWCQMKMNLEFFRYYAVREMKSIIMYQVWGLISCRIRDNTIILKTLPNLA